MSQEHIEVIVSGKALKARPGLTLTHALWEAGRAGEVQTGCDGGVCGACTVSIQLKGDSKTLIDLACQRQVEDGMTVFPYPAPTIPAVAPNREISPESIRAAFPTLDRCTKCGACSMVCPMDIPVMDSVTRMRSGAFEEAAEDFTSCIHCGQCRVVCEDRVKPHNMGMWVRRSLGMAQNWERLAGSAVNSPDESWDLLLDCDEETRLARCREFRKTGRVES